MEMINIFYIADVRVHANMTLILETKGLLS